jgi:hypothetical protein
MNAPKNGAPLTAASAAAVLQLGKAFAFPVPREPESDGARIEPEAWGMDYDQDKVDEMVLALLWLTQTSDGRAWKGQDWDAMERLHTKGYISDPKSKAKSVVLSEEGERLSRELFERHFARKG